MKSVCANCDLGLTRSECTDSEYVDCEFRRWTIEEIKSTTMHGFMCILDATLGDIYENKNDLRNIKLRMIEYLSKELIE